MSNCAIVGINWGDEGKGRMVDLLTQALLPYLLSQNAVFPKLQSGYPPVM